MPLKNYLGDSIFDIDMKPNRADGLSILGIARDVAALTGGKVREPDLEFPAEGGPIGDRIKIGIDDPDLCPRYTGALIEGIQIGPVSALDAAENDCGGNATYQQRRRHFELRDAGARPTDPCLRLRHHQGTHHYRSDVQRPVRR